MAFARCDARVFSGSFMSFMINGLPGAPVRCKQIMPAAPDGWPRSPAHRKASGRRWCSAGRRVTPPADLLELFVQGGVAPAGEPGRPDHQQRLADAQERLGRAREAHLTALCK